MPYDSYVPVRMSATNLEMIFERIVGVAASDAQGQAQGVMAVDQRGLEVHASRFDVDRRA